MGSPPFFATASHVYPPFSSPLAPREFKSKLDAAEQAASTARANTDSLERKKASLTALVEKLQTDLASVRRELVHERGECAKLGSRMASIVESVAKINLASTHINSLAQPAFGGSQLL